MTREEYEKRVQEIYEKHGVVPTPVKTREEMIKAPHFQGRINYNSDKKVPEIK